ncbi:MAG TPA: hypothetical protein VFR43_11175 [Gaiellaceae bacterium]|nr:hypothetical protein [Gaiellaceae bacterium]
MVRAAIVAAMAAAAVVLVVGVSGGGAAVTPSRAAIVQCFEQRRVLADPGAATYLPARIVARSRQIALSFALVPSVAAPGVTAVAVTSPSPAVAARTLARIVRSVTIQGNVPDRLVGRYFQQRGTTVLVWMTDSNANARRIATACLGPRTA